MRDLKDCVTFDVDESEIKDYIQRNYDPDEIFDDAELSKWAKANGFVEEE